MCILLSYSNTSLDPFSLCPQFSLWFQYLSFDDMVVGETLGTSSQFDNVAEWEEKILLFIPLAITWVSTLGIFPLLRGSSQLHCFDLRGCWPLLPSS